jgi:tetratricopeptide (TPR) repeat protein
VLVTSRDARWERHATLAELELFTADEAVAFLLARTASGDRPTAAEIAGLLGRLPLALEQAGAYTRETRLLLAAYAERLRRFPALAVARGRPRDRDPVDTVATTWHVSLEQVQPVPGAVGLLEVCAFLSPGEIPRELFATRLDPPVAELDTFAEDPFALDEAIAALNRFGLVKAGEQTLVVHRLLQQVVREGLGPAAGFDRAGAAVRLLAEAFPVHGLEDPSVWPRCAQLLPHAVAAASHAGDFGAEPSATIALLDGADRYLEARARHLEAQMLAEDALMLAERAPAPAEGARGPESDTIPDRLLRLAVMLHAQSEFQGARTLYERALAIHEANLGPNHPTTATALNDLGTVLRDEGDLDRARALLERALTIHETQLGPNHPTTATTLSNLARVLRDQGDLNQARTLLERALSIRETRLGTDHSDTATTRNDLAGVLRDQGDLDRARALYEQALSIRETRLGPHHPDTTQSRELLAALEGPQ